MAKKISLPVCALLIALDQIVKAWAVTALNPPGGRITVIPGLFYLTYVENRGAAFGLFQGGTMALAVVSLIVLLALLYLILSGRVKEPFLIWSLSLILAGGLGNLIDRFARGFVVDYLDFSALLNFPVFNLADCCVVCGTGMILIYVLFFENRKKKAAEEENQAPEAGKEPDHEGS